MPEGALPIHILLSLSNVQLVEARVEQLGVAPGVDQVAGGIELNHRRREVPRVQVALEARPGD